LKIAIIHKQGKQLV